MFSHHMGKFCIVLSAEIKLVSLQLVSLERPPCVRQVGGPRLSTDRDRYDQLFKIGTGCFLFLGTQQ